MALDMTDDGRDRKPWPQDCVSPLDLWESIQILGHDWAQIFPPLENNDDDERYVEEALSYHGNPHQYRFQNKLELGAFIHRMDYLVELVYGLEMNAMDLHGEDYIDYLASGLGLASGDYPNYLEDLLTEIGAEDHKALSETLVLKTEFTGWLEGRMKDVRRDESVLTTEAEQKTQLVKICEILGVSPGKGAGCAL